MKNGNQKVHPKMTKWKKQKMGKIQKKIKISSSEYRAEKVTGFNKENVHEKIKLMEVHPTKGDFHKLYVL